MKKLLALLLVGSLLSLTTGCPGSTPPGKPAQNPKGTSSQGEPSKADKLVGKWTFEKAVAKDGKPDKNAPPEGTTLEFAKDGVLKMTSRNPETKKDETLSGTYKVEGDKIATTLKPPVPNVPEDKQTLTITTLTDTELALKDKNGITATFKKK